jgi:uncharacterized protein (DUF3084 family)
MLDPATLSVFAGKFALQSAPKILDTFLGNNQANEQRRQQEAMYKLKFNQERDRAIRAHQAAFAQVDAYNKGLVAKHNSRVETYNLNIDLLQKEEAYAYQAMQLQAGSEVAAFMEENVDLLTEYVQSSGSLAASGMGTAASKLSELKNSQGGFLKARRRLQGNTAGAISGIIKNIEKAEMQGNAQRASMYQAVKNKPTLRSYPTMGQLPSYRTPDAFKTRGPSFMDFAPGLAEAGIGAGQESGLFKQIGKSIFGG